ncbi:MAG: FAD-binding oxidoreductase [Rhodobacteraceae bacterium]|nr:FAD-binding oxidoreductase [Paracoccaceae bacterium]
MAMADICVVGAGVMGLSVAWACARRGARVMVCEAALPGAGASGGVVGALAPHAPERWDAAKAFQLEALMMAEGWWANVARTGGGDPGYARLGRVQPLPDEAAIARAEARAEGAARHWGGQAEWRLVRAEAWRGLVPHSPTGWLAHDSLSARLAPRAALGSLLAALRSAGAEIVTGQPMPAGPGSPGRAQLPPARAHVWATGAAGLVASRGADGLALGGGVKGQAAVLALSVPLAAQVSAPGLHVVPHADGTVAVGSTSERVWQHAEKTDDALEAVIERARGLVPALAKAPVLARWAGLRPRARDGRPLAGPLPGFPGHWIANGGFKTGFALAPALAEALAEALLGEGAGPPAAFLPDRLDAPRGDGR